MINLSTFKQFLLQVCGLKPYIVVLIILAVESLASTAALRCCADELSDQNGVCLGYVSYKFW